MVVAEVGSPMTDSEDLTGKTITVVGLGKSGMAAVRFLQGKGARIRVADHRSLSDLSQQLSQLDQETVEVFSGERFEEGFHNSDVVVISPGVPSDMEILRKVRQQGVPVIGELELATRHLTGKLIAVTGTNGKSTVVSLIAQMWEQSGHHVFLGGNVGIPLCEALLPHMSSKGTGKNSDPYDVVVAEVSSFQLETIDRFHPHMAVLLNVTGDHLDRYASFDHYQLTKARIFENQTPEDYAVVSGDDPIVSALQRNIPSSLYEFSTRRSLDQGAFLEGEQLIFVNEGERLELGSVKKMGMRGEHNVANVLAASLVSMLGGCSLPAIQSVLETFRGIPHAQEVIRERRGVLYVNDSKGTNVDATLKAMNSFAAPLYIILGGKDKGGDFDRLREVLRQNGKKILLIGEAAPRIQEALEGLEGIVRMSSLQEAVELASREAHEGDVVLLSPACASFDMFRDYQDRGDQFREAVHALS